jgi:hypothetical protein
MDLIRSLLVFKGRAAGELPHNVLPRESSCEALIQATGLVPLKDITVAGQGRIFTGLR